MTDDSTSSPNLNANAAAGAGSRRRPRWYAVTALAVAGMVGVGGYALGAQNNSSAPSQPSAAPGDVAGGPAPVARGNSDAPAITPQGGAESMQSSMVPGFFGHRTFKASGLSDTESTALGFTFDSSAVTPATIEALAAALGVTGALEQQDGMWFVGPRDQSAPYFGVFLYSGLDFTYANPANSPWICPPADPAVEPGGTPEGGTEIEGCVSATPPPSEEAAIESVRDFLVTLGRDPVEFEFTSFVYEGASHREVQAWVLADGQRTEYSITVSVAGSGIASAYGPLAELVSLGEYSVVSEQEAFERLTDSRFGAHQTSWPADDPASTEVITWTPPTAPPTTPGEGTAVAWPVTDVEITGARLILQGQYQDDGTVRIVPAYEFTASDGGTWSVIAVADEGLDFSSQS